MSLLTESPQWQRLQAHQKEMQSCHLSHLFQADPKRFEKFSHRHAGLILDYSKNLITDHTLELLIQLAQQAQLNQAIEALFTGSKVNTTQQLPALHTALRDPDLSALFIEGKNIMPDIRANLRKMTDCIHKRQKQLKQIVHLGIGGSYLGPKMAVQALAQNAANPIKIKFISYDDEIYLTHLVQNIDPKTCLFILASKSLTTLETRKNAEIVIHRLKQRGLSIADHCLAITHYPDKAEAFGIPAENIFTLTAWIGGRYSLWSAMGLSLAFLIGMEGFLELLAGARAMDQHFRATPFIKNMPVILALLTIWYRNFFHTHAHAILPYDARLKYLPAYLQQLLMESNGKSIQNEGQKINYSTCPVIFGELGFNAQHSFYQLLHQGSELLPIDFLVSFKNHLNTQQPYVLANVLSQSKALMDGYKGQYSYQTLAGNRPSTTLALTDITPSTLGALLALYEHKTFVESVIWSIDPFDQWGVEYGKQLNQELFAHLKEDKPRCVYDSSTEGLLALYRDAYT